MNIPPNDGKEPREIGRLNRAATDWLNKNDKRAKLERFKASKKRERDEQQARNNPALVAAYRKAMLKAR